MKRLIILILTILVGLGYARADEPVLPADGLVKIAAGCMRSAPAHSSELVSQAVMGTPLKLLEKQDGWWLVETPEGYRGYMIASSLTPVDSVAMHRWRDSNRVMYTGFYTGRIVSALGDGAVISDIHPGSVLRVVRQHGADSIYVALPDGRRGVLPSSAVTNLEEFRYRPVDTRQIINMAKALTGVSYLWGGTTSAAMDCSGLAKICYLNQGIILQRDASQQARTGEILGTDFNDYRRGDLVFFKSATTGKIVHVGIYDHDGQYVHSSGRVRTNSLDPSNQLYIKSNILASGSRIVGKIDTDGITRITSSPAYFNL